MARIASFGAYVPLYRLSRQQIGDAWGIPAVPGERAVANADEDSLTMAVAAGLDCLAGIDPSTHRRAVLRDDDGALQREAVARA